MTAHRAIGGAGSETDFGHGDDSFYAGLGMRTAALTAAATTCESVVSMSDKRSRSRQG